MVMSHTLCVLYSARRIIVESHRMNGQTTLNFCHYSCPHSGQQSLSVSSLSRQLVVYTSIHTLEARVIDGRSNRV